MFTLRFHYDPNGNTGVEEVFEEIEKDKTEVYILTGVRLFEDLKNLPRGIYIYHQR